MLVNGVRFCDACNKPIPDSEERVVSTIPREKASLFLSLFARTENAGKPHVTLEGTVEITICLQCDLDMAELPNEFVD
jgi:hypothetical protein